MPAARRLDPEAVAARLRVHHRNRRRDWLVGGGNWPLAVPLHPPTEREAALDPEGARAWIATWQSCRGPGGLIWTERTWPSLGRQRLPERLLLNGAEQVADWIGEGGRWRLAVARHQDLSRRFPALGEHLGHYVDWLADSTDVELERLAAVLDWLCGHADSGYYIRQLPITGVDSKWIAANRARVTELLRHLLGGEGDLCDLAGLRREPVLLRMRLLDPGLRAAVGRLEDITAPVDQIAALPLQPSCVFIVENPANRPRIFRLSGQLGLYGPGLRGRRLRHYSMVAKCPLRLLGRPGHARARHP